MCERPVIIVSEDDKRAIRETINITNIQRLQNDIDSISEWFKKQQHLPRIELDHRIIESILISRKGSVEQTKQKIDMMYTIKNIIPDMAAPRDVLHPRIMNTLKACQTITMPKINHDLTKVVIINNKGDIKFYNPIDLMNYLLAMLDYRMLHDYCLGLRYVMDFQYLKLGHFTKFTPSVLKYSELYVRKAYGVRIFGIHIINVSSFVGKVLNLFKIALSDKLYSKITIHDSYDDLYKIIDRDILPAELGGNDQTIDQITENWIKELSKEDVREYLINQESLRSNESERIGSKLDDDLLGIAGSFRKLEVD